MGVLRQEMLFCFFFKQKTAYEILAYWSSDVCSSDLGEPQALRDRADLVGAAALGLRPRLDYLLALRLPELDELVGAERALHPERGRELREALAHPLVAVARPAERVAEPLVRHLVRPDVLEEGVRAELGAEELRARL